MKPKEKSCFTGPVFIVGMPRSGTKLLRDLLNNHPSIAITPIESHCIPYFYKRIKRYGKLKDFSGFEKFYKDFSKTLFFQTLSRREKLIGKVEWYEQVEKWSYSGILEAFYRAYARDHSKTVWGDKTPSYLLHMPLLKELFPGAKFIHIIRDARDCCLSAHKAWRKNIYRAAQRWCDSIRKCRQDARAFTEEAYYEVRYERLLSLPEDTMKSVCDFLHIPYDHGMLVMEKPVEKLGRAKNIAGILENNYGKWEHSSGTADMAKIERICGSLLFELGYSVSHSGDPLSLGRVEMALYKLFDGWNQLRMDCENRCLSHVLRDMVKSRIHRLVSKGL